MRIDHILRGFSGLVGILLLVLVFGSAKAADPKDIVCKADDVCRIAKTRLPLRVLPRPFSRRYSTQKASPDAVLPGKTAEFHPLYVRKREGVSFDDPTNPTGWYEVSARVTGPAIGWMQAKDVLEWRNLLIVAYTHPGTDKNRRQQVLMFNKLDDLKKAVESDKRADNFKAMADQIKAGEVPKGVISSEPARFLNIDQTFYILPVLQFERLEAFDDDARYLQIAAAVPGKRAEPGQADTLANKKFMIEVNKESKLGDHAPGVDIVFVMDMTNSMGPHIEMTKSALTDVAKLIGQKAADPDLIRYGLVGYRDNHKKMPGLEFTAKNFTPELIAGEQKFVEVINRDARAASSSSEDYAEEVYAGLKLAIGGIKWRKKSIRFIILVGDASAHEPGHDLSTTGLGASQIRSMANDAKVTIMGIHLKLARAAPDHPIALDQFNTVTTNPGTDGPVVASISADDEDAYNAAVKLITKNIVVQIAHGPGGGGTSPGPTTAAPAASGSISGATVRQAAKAALITYLGKEAEPPKDLTVWVMDRDVVDPAIPALSVRVMISKADLSNLHGALDQLVAALAQQGITQEKFFDALQGVVSANLSGTKVTLKQGEKLAKTGLLPRWIDSLPYKSAILSMTDDMFDQLSADDRARLENSLEGKLSYYKDILDSSDKWIKLDEKAASLDAVYPLPLDELP